MPELIYYHDLFERSRAKRGEGSCDEYSADYIAFDRRIKARCLLTFEFIKAKRLAH